MPAERELDGTIEAVNQATVSAQTSGRVAEIFHDVNDFVPAGMLMMPRSTEQGAGLQQAEAALEATAREAEAQTRYARIRDMYERKVVAKAQLDQVAARVMRRRAAGGGPAAVERPRGRGLHRGARALRRHRDQRLVRVGEAVAPGTPLMSGCPWRTPGDRGHPAELVEQVRKLARPPSTWTAGGSRPRITIFRPRTRPRTPSARAWTCRKLRDLYPGMFVKVGFVTGEARGSWSPSAIVERSEVTAVYVVGPDGRVPSGRCGRQRAATGSRFLRAWPPASAWRSIRWPRASMRDAGVEP